MNYTHDEVLWILYNYHALSYGDIPKEREQVGSFVRNFRAPYETACIMAAEVCVRVKKCGVDGMLVEEKFGLLTGYSQTEKEIGRRRQMYVDDVYNRINRVTWYCTGINIKKQSYEGWKRENRYKRILRPEIPVALATTAVCVSS